MGELEKVYRMTHGAEKIDREDREDMLVFSPFPFSLQKPELEVTQ